MKQKAYTRAGVDIDLGNRVKATLPKLLASTHRREVLGKVGGFGGLFALDIGLSTMWAQPITGLTHYLDIFKSGRGLRFVIGLSGIAISGGLFIVPVFSAIQAWAGPDRRARVIAGVNVINAGFMAASCESDWEIRRCNLAVSARPAKRVMKSAAAVETQATRHSPGRVFRCLSLECRKSTRGRFPSRAVMPTATAQAPF